jgi:hypothetical protein
VYAGNLKALRPKIFAYERAKLGVIVDNKNPLHKMILVAALCGKQ